MAARPAAEGRARPRRKHRERAQAAARRTAEALRRADAASVADRRPAAARCERRARARRRPRADTQRAPRPARNASRADRAPWRRRKGSAASGDRGPRRDAAGRPRIASAATTRKSRDPSAAREGADPNSPFAKLAALKAQLEAEPRSAQLSRGGDRCRRTASASTNGCGTRAWCARARAAALWPTPVTSGSTACASMRREPAGAVRRCRHGRARSRGAHPEGDGLCERRGGRRPRGALRGLDAVSERRGAAPFRARARRRTADQAAPRRSGCDGSRSR